MKRPPRKPDEALFGPRQLFIAALQGLVILAGVLVLFVYAVATLTVEQARGAAFIALVVANLTLALVDAVGAEGRILDPERRIYWIIAGVLMVVLALVVASPWLAGIFHLAAPGVQYVLLAIGVGFVSGAWHWPLLRFGAWGRRA